MAAVIGEFADIESITALRDLMHRLDCDNFEIRNSSTKLDADLRANYIMNSTIQGLDFTDLLLLVACNPKYEAPVINSRILKNTNKNHLQVGVIGTAHDLNYHYSHLGTTAKALQELLDGTHPFCKDLENAKMPMIMVGTTLLEREDGEQLLNKCKELTKKYGNIVNNE